MVEVNGKTITMTRGDSFHTVLILQHRDGTPFYPVADDTILFVVKENYSDDTVLINVEVPHDTMTVDFGPSATADLDIGKYVWEMKLITADGDVDTFIPKGVLKLDNEVVTIEEEEEEEELLI